MQPVAEQVLVRRGGHAPVRWLDPECKWKWIIRVHRGDLLTRLEFTPQQIRAVVQIGRQETTVWPGSVLQVVVHENHPGVSTAGHWVRQRLRRMKLQPQSVDQREPV